MALRPDPADASRTSVEMLNVPRQKRDRQQNWENEDTNRKITLRERFSPFPWKTFFVVSALPFALAPITVLATWAEQASVGYILGRNCYPNGLWKEAPNATWRIMDSSYFFTPNLSFGSMTFTQVKVIDITWDLLIGRGGQLLLAWVNYRVFNEWLLYHMEMHSTSYKMYTALAFETTSMSTLGVLGKEFLAFGGNSRRRFFRWMAILCMLLSTLYVLSFPTLMAAMTGYITTYKAYIEDYENNLIEWDRLIPVTAFIQDSDRIGFNKTLIATDKDDDMTDAIMSYFNNVTGEAFSILYGQHYAPTEIVSFAYNKPSIWNFEGQSTQLDAPTLNITWLVHLDPIQQGVSDITHNYYSHDGRQGDLFNRSYVLAHGSCKPSEAYQWGFSYIFLFMMSIFNFIWSCIMVGMWLDTCRGSRMYKSGRRPGLLRSIMDISGAIKEELGENVDSLEEKELRQGLRDSGGALFVPRRELRIARTVTEEAVKRRGWKRAVTTGSTF